MTVLEKPYENFTYMDNLLTYVNEHSEKNAILREGTDVDRLAMVEGVFLDMVRPVMEQIYNMNLHWALDRYLDNLHRLHLSDPQPGTTYILCDHKAAQCLIA